jgi:hypothetical protein
LDPIRQDFEAILEAAKPEIPFLIEALATGKVDGSTYRDSESNCGCLVGTLEIARGVEENCVVERNSSRPAERWFLAIKHGDTPETNPVSAISLGWAKEYLEKVSKVAK